MEQPENTNVPRLPTYEERVQWAQKKHYLRLVTVKSWVPVLLTLLVVIGVSFAVAILSRLVILMYGL